MLLFQLREILLEKKKRTRKIALNPILPLPKQLESNIIKEIYLFVTKKVRRPEFLSILSIGTIEVSSLIYLEKRRKKLHENHFKMHYKNIFKQRSIFPMFCNLPVNSNKNPEPFLSLVVI